MKKILALAFMMVVLFANISYAKELSDAEKEIFEKGFYVKEIDDELFERIKGNHAETRHLFKIFFCHPF